MPEWKPNIVDEHTNMVTFGRRVRPKCHQSPSVKSSPALFITISCSTSYVKELRYLSLTTLIPTTPEGGKTESGTLPQDVLVLLIAKRDCMAAARTPLEHSTQLLHRMVSSFGHRTWDASSAAPESRIVSRFSTLFLTTYEVLRVNVFSLPLLISRLTRVELVHWRHSIRSSSDMVISSK
jgi:hypothetical protein